MWYYDKNHGFGRTEVTWVDSSENTVMIKAGGGTWKFDYGIDYPVKYPRGVMFCFAC